MLGLEKLGLDRITSWVPRGARAGGTKSPDGVTASSERGSSEDRGERPRGEAPGSTDTDAQREALPLEHESSPLAHCDAPSGNAESGRAELPELSWQGLTDLEDLRALLEERFDGVELLNFENRPVRGIQDDSRRVRRGDVFFAIPGLSSDGAQFATQAVGQGASAVVACRPLPVEVPVFLVPDVRRAAGHAAAAFHRHPSRQFPVVGVTGTNGKTTVTDLLSLCLEDQVGSVGSLGTIRYRLGPRTREELGNRARSGGLPADLASGDDSKDPSSGSAFPDDLTVPAINTTPGPVEIQGYLAEMRERSVRAAVLEVSSHALHQGRCDAIRFEAAILTNLTQDHLDYHGSMDGYAEAKARLFASLEPGALAVLPSDDPASAKMLEVLPPHARLCTWSLATQNGGRTAKGRGKVGVETSFLAGSNRLESEFHVHAEILEAGLNGTKVLFDTPEGKTEVELPLIGEHNVRNALAALSCAIGLGVGALRATDSLSRARPVDGRLERVDRGRVPFGIFVDYAHTPDALEQVLAAAKRLTKGRLRVVFGCGGDRDRSKRPQMGRIACRHADHVVITQDNPRNEDPSSIVEQILAGTAAEDASCHDLEISHDRRRAIRHALGRARAGDIVLICGKGHERGQVIGGHVIPFDDREEVEAWLCGR